MTTSERQNTVHKTRRKSVLIQLKRTWILYIFLLPAFIYLVLFHYAPLYGIQIAFKDFEPTQGIWKSEWVGLQQFITFFDSYQFWDLLKNTVVLSAYALIAGFPVPIILAILLHYTTCSKFRKLSQMITYAPHFISTVVFCGMLLLFLADDGIFNQLLQIFGISPIPFLSEPKNFKHIYVWSGILQSMGFSSIIYISVLSSVSPELHEAATVDGANKLQRIWHIDCPALLPTAIILLIMSAGSILNVGFEKVYLLQNPINLQYSEIISTYVYKVGIQSTQFSYSAAIGLFNNIVNFIVLIIINKFAHCVSEISLW